MRGELKEIELYDRENDPYETRNIADSVEAEIKTSLSNQLAAGWQNALPE